MVRTGDHRTSKNQAHVHSKIFREKANSFLLLIAVPMNVLYEHNPIKGNGPTNKEPKRKPTSEDSRAYYQKSQGLFHGVTVESWVSTVGYVV